MDWAGQVFAQPATDPYKIGWVVFQPATVTDSKRDEISLDPARSCQIHPRSGEIPSDLARFLANRDEKSLVRPNPVFIMPKIDGFK